MMHLSIECNPTDLFASYGVTQDEWQRALRVRLETLGGFEYDDGYEPGFLNAISAEFGSIDTHRNGQYFMWSGVAEEAFNQFTRATLRVLKHSAVTEHPGR